MLRQIADFRGLALAHRDVAHDRAILRSIGALPAREARLDRKYFAALAAPVELDDGARRGSSRLADRMRGALGLGPVGVNHIERLADHFLRLVAEDRRRA